MNALSPNTVALYLTHEQMTASQVDVLIALQCVGLILLIVVSTWWLLKNREGTKNATMMNGQTNTY